MAKDHAALAACLALVVGRAAGLPAPELLATAGVATGAALLPDLDEPGSTVSHMLEPISGAVAHITRRLAGGHRMATHSLLAAALAGVGTWALATFTLGHLGGVTLPASGIIVALCFALAVRGLLPRHGGLGHVGALIVGCAATWVVARYVGLGTWVPLAVCGGVVAHLVGDALTTGGVPLAWPISKRHYSLAVLSHTNSWREHVVGLGLLGLLIAAAWVPVAALIHPA